MSSILKKNDFFLVEQTCFFMFLAEKMFAEKNRLVIKLQTKPKPLSFTTLQCKKFNALFYNNMLLFSIRYFCCTFQTILLLTVKTVL